MQNPLQIGLLIGLQKIGLPFSSVQVWTSTPKNGLDSSGHYRKQPRSNSFENRGGPDARKSIRAVSFRVGSRSWIFGIDPISEMVAAARRAADRHGLKNAKFDVALADHLPFSAGTFDAVISRFGVIFLAYNTL